MFMNPSIPRSSSTMNAPPQFVPPAPGYWQRTDQLMITHPHSHHQQFPIPSHNDNHHRPSMRPRTSPNRYSPYKTELCLKFLKGNCTYGDNCRFAHRLPKFDNPTISRARLCWRYSQEGQCPYGNTCHFIHDNNTRMRSTITIVNNRGPGGCHNVGSGNGGDSTSHEVKGGLLDGEKQVYRRPLVEKTRMCKKWEANGSCPYAHNCKFAHGESELMKFETVKASASASASVNTPKEEVRGKQWVFKWTNIEKISRIYADWMENMPLVHDSSDTMEV